MDGILVVLKPPGMTSHDAVAYARRQTGQRKIGHTGTLDPGAAGVLVLCLGKATRVIPFLADQPKSYRVEMRLGWSTDTYDASGRQVEEKRDAQVCGDRLLSALQSFMGDIQQVPPMVSAVKHQGRRLYELARRGQVVQRRPRWVHIYDITPVGQWEGRTFRYGDRLQFDVTCSQGTYMRSLCHNLGKKVQIPIHMSFLLRTRVGPWTLAEAVTLQEIAARGGRVNGAFPARTGWDDISYTQTHHLRVRALDEGLLHLPGVCLEEGAAERIMCGAPLYWKPDRENSPVLAFIAAGTFPGAARNAAFSEAQITGKAGPVQEPAGPGLVRVYGPGGDFLAVGEWKKQRGQWHLRARRVLGTRGSRDCRG